MLGVSSGASFDFELGCSFKRVRVFLVEVNGSGPGKDSVSCCGYVVDKLLTAWPQRHWPSSEHGYECELRTSEAHLGPPPRDTSTNTITRILGK